MNSVNNDIKEYNFYTETQDAQGLASSVGVQETGTQTSAATVECSEAITTCTDEDDQVVLDITDDIEEDYTEEYTEEYKEEYTAEDEPYYDEWGIDESSKQAELEGIYASSSTSENLKDYTLNSDSNLPDSLAALPHTKSFKVTKNGVTYYIIKTDKGTYYYDKAGATGRNPGSAANFSELQIKLKELGITITSDTSDTENVPFGASAGSSVKDDLAVKGGDVVNDIIQDKQTPSSAGEEAAKVIRENNSSAYDFSVLTPVSSLPDFLNIKSAADFGLDGSYGIVQYYTVNVDCGAGITIPMYAALSDNGQMGAIYQHFTGDDYVFCADDTPYYDLTTFMQTYESNAISNRDSWIAYQNDKPNETVSAPAQTSTSQTSTGQTDETGANNPFGDNYATPVKISEISDADLKAALMKGTGKTNATAYRINAYETQWTEIDVYAYQNKDGVWCCYPALNGQTEFNSTGEILNAAGYNEDYKNTQTSMDDIIQAAQNTDDADHMSYYPEEELRQLEAIFGPNFAPAAITTSDGVTHTIGINADGTAAIVTSQTTSTVNEDGTTTTDTAYTTKTYNSYEELKAENPEAVNVIEESQNKAGEWLQDNPEAAERILHAFENNLRSYQSALDELASLDGYENQELINEIQTAINNAFSSIENIRENQNYNSITGLFYEFTDKLLTEDELDSAIKTINAVQNEGLIQEERNAALENLSEFFPINSVRSQLGELQYNIQIKEVKKDFDNRNQDNEDVVKAQKEIISFLNTLLDNYETQYEAIRNGNCFSEFGNAICNLLNAGTSSEDVENLIANYRARLNEAEEDPSQIYDVYKELTGKDLTFDEYQNLVWQQKALLTESSVVQVNVTMDELSSVLGEFETGYDSAVDTAGRITGMAAATVFLLPATAVEGLSGGLGTGAIIVAEGAVYAVGNGVVRQIAALTGGDSYTITEEAASFAADFMKGVAFSSAGEFGSTIAGICQNSSCQVISGLTEWIVAGTTGAYISDLNTVADLSESAWNGEDIGTGFDVVKTLVNAGVRGTVGGLTFKGIDVVSSAALKDIGNNALDAEIISETGHTVGTSPASSSNAIAAGLKASGAAVFSTVASETANYILSDTEEEKSFNGWLDTILEKDLLSVLADGFATGTFMTLNGEIMAEYKQSVPTTYDINQELKLQNTYEENGITYKEYTDSYGNKYIKYNQDGISYVEKYDAYGALVSRKGNYTDGDKTYTLDGSYRNDTTPRETYSYADSDASSETALSTEVTGSSGSTENAQNNTLAGIKYTMIDSQTGEIHSLTEYYDASGTKVIGYDIPVYETGTLEHFGITEDIIKSYNLENYETIRLEGSSIGYHTETGWDYKTDFATLKYNVSGVNYDGESVPLVDNNGNLLTATTERVINTTKTTAGEDGGSSYTGAQSAIEGAAGETGGTTVTTTDTTGAATTGTTGAATTGTTGTATTGTTEVTVPAETTVTVPVTGEITIPSNGTNVPAAGTENGNVIVLLPDGTATIAAAITADSTGIDIYGSADSDTGVGAGAAADAEVTDTDAAAYGTAAADTGVTTDTGVGTYDGDNGSTGVAAGENIDIATTLKNAGLSDNCATELAGAGINEHQMEMAIKYNAMGFDDESILDIIRYGQNYTSLIDDFISAFQDNNQIGTGHNNTARFPSYVDNEDEIETRVSWETDGTKILVTRDTRVQLNKDDTTSPISSTISRIEIYADGTIKKIYADYTENSLEIMSQKDPITDIDDTFTNVVISWKTGGTEICVRKHTEVQTNEDGTTSTISQIVRTENCADGTSRELYTDGSESSFEIMSQKDPIALSEADFYDELCKNNDSAQNRYYKAISEANEYGLISIKDVDFLTSNYNFENEYYTPEEYVDTYLIFRGTYKISSESEAQFLISNYDFKNRYYKPEEYAAAFAFYRDVTTPDGTKIFKNNDAIKRVLEVDPASPEAYYLQKQILAIQKGELPATALLYYDGDTTVSNLGKNTAISDSQKSDYDEIDDVIADNVKASDLQQDIADNYVKTYASVDEALLEVEIGDAFVVEEGDPPYYIIMKTGDESFQQMKITKETYTKLFPMGKRFATSQGSLGDCYFIETVMALYDNPSTRAQLISMISETGDGNITIKFPTSNVKTTFENGNLPDIENSSVYSSGADGFVLFEYAYANYLLQNYICSNGNALPQDKLMEFAKFAKDNHNDVYVYTENGETKWMTYTEAKEKGMITLSGNRTPYDTIEEHLLGKGGKAYNAALVLGLEIEEHESAEKDQNGNLENDGILKILQNPENTKYKNLYEDNIVLIAMRTDDGGGHEYSITRETDENGKVSYIIYDPHCQGVVSILDDISNLSISDILIIKK